MKKSSVTTNTKKVFQQKSAKMKEIKKKSFVCNICGGKKAKYLYSSKDYVNNIPGIFSIYQCKTCRTVQTFPVPTQKQLEKFYPDTTPYYQDGGNLLNIIQTKGAVLNKVFSYPKNITQKFQGKNTKHKLAQWYDAKVLHIQGVPHYKENATLLDVGCSTGGYIQVMNTLGWKTTGIEMNKKSVAVCKQKGLNVHHGTIENFKTKEKFDVIYAGMVVEHIINPVAFLQQVKNLLKENGTFIFAIPNIGGIEAKIYKKYAYTLQLPNHITHFTPKTIASVLKGVGFSKPTYHFHVVTRDAVTPLVYMKKEGIIGAGFFYKICNISIIRNIGVKGSQFIASLIGKTSRMTIYTTYRK